MLNCVGRNRPLNTARFCLGICCRDSLNQRSKELLPSACGEPLHLSILEASVGMWPLLHPGFLSITPGWMSRWEGWLPELGGKHGHGLPAPWQLRRVVTGARGRREPSGGSAFRRPGKGTSTEEPRPAARSRQRMRSCQTNVAPTRLLDVLVTLYLSP